MFSSPSPVQLLLRYQSREPIYENFITLPPPPSDNSANIDTPLTPDEQLFFQQMEKASIDASASSGSTQTMITPQIINSVQLDRKVNDNMLKNNEVASLKYGDYNKTDYVHPSLPTLMDAIEEDSHIMAIQENNMYMALTMCLATVSIIFVMI